MKLDVWLHMQNERDLHKKNILMTPSVKRQSGSLHPWSHTFSYNQKQSCQCRDTIEKSPFSCRFSFLSPAGTSSHFHCHLVSWECRWQQDFCFKCRTCQKETSLKEMDVHKSWSWRTLSCDLVLAMFTSLQDAEWAMSLTAMVQLNCQSELFH